MKYKIAEEQITNIQKYKIDDLLIFKKPYKNKIHITLKNKQQHHINTQDYTYISLSHKGFLFIQDKPYKIRPIMLQDIAEIKTE